MHQFFMSLNNYQGLFDFVAFILVPTTFVSKKVRKWISKAIKHFFTAATKDIHDRLDESDKKTGSLEATVLKEIDQLKVSLGAVVKELTQNGGAGGLKTSTMKDNIGKCLRDIGTVQEWQEEDRKRVENLDGKVGDMSIELARMQAKVEAFVR